jgi:hypothetical protein
VEVAKMPEEAEVGVVERMPEVVEEAVERMPEEVEEAVERMPEVVEEAVERMLEAVGEEKMPEEKMSEEGERMPEEVVVAEKMDRKASRNTQDNSRVCKDHRLNNISYRLGKTLSDCYIPI